MKQDSPDVAMPVPIGYRVCYLVQRYTANFYHQIAQDQGLSQFPFVVLFCLGAAEPLGAAQICGMSGQARPDIDAAIIDLLGRRFVNRRADPKHPKEPLLTLTANGRAALAKAMPSLIEHERRMLAPLTPEECNTLFDLLGKMTRRGSRPGVPAVAP
jgi:DNA-binding MarR family transcriptional regulator